MKVDVLGRFHVKIGGCLVSAPVTGYLLKCRSEAGTTNLFSVFASLAYLEER